MFARYPDTFGLFSSLFLTVPAVSVSVSVSMSLLLRIRSKVDKSNQNESIKTSRNNTEVIFVTYHVHPKTLKGNCGLRQNMGTPLKLYYRRPRNKGYSQAPPILKTVYKATTRD